MSTPIYSDSYDLLIKLAPFNETLGDAWGFSGQPMRELKSVQNRVKRQRKDHGARLQAWRIVRMRLDVHTGHVAFSVMEEGQS
jgi:hypothetical protein